MTHYISDEDVNGNVSFGFDENQFGELKFAASLIQLKEHKQDPMFNIMLGGSIFGGPIEHKGMLYFGATDKNFYCVSTDGRLVWKFETQAQILSPPCASDGIVYFGSYDTNLYALDAETGELLWKFRTRAPIACNPLATEDAVYIGSWDCHMYAINPENGQEIWSFKTSMSNMATMEVEHLKAKGTTQVMWTQETVDEKKEETIQEDIKDYGTFSGTYIESTDNDYVGGFGKKGYKSG